MAAVRQQATQKIKRCVSRKGDILMNNNYFRITAYNPEKDVCLIADSYGYFSKLWEFSSFWVNNGFKIIAVGSDAKFSDGNINRINETEETFAIRACAMGQPEFINGVITINGKTYKPNKNE